MGSNAELKSLAQGLINNDICCKELGATLKDRKKEQKEMKEQLQGLMTDKSIDVLHKNGTKIELKQVERKDPMNKEFVRCTLETFLDPQVLEAAMAKLYDNRPKSTHQMLKLATPSNKRGRVELDQKTEMSDASDMATLANQFDL
jgi:hypothetical protein